MNSTLQTFLQDSVLCDNFRYGDAKIEYDNRLINLLSFYFSSRLLYNNRDYNELKQYVINKRLNILASYKNNWANAPNWVIQEIELILKCFADDEDFYQTLVNYFGANCTCLPPDAIDMSYEFFLLSNRVDNLVEKIENSEQVNHYFGPKRFKDFMSVKNPLFLGIQANDAKDLVQFLIMTWHEEQNKAKLKQNKSPQDIANHINQLSQQIHNFIVKMQESYNAYIIAMSNGNQQLANCSLSNVYFDKQNIQYLVNNIIQYANMINNISPKHKNTVANIINWAQGLSTSLGGYNGINDFKGSFDIMDQYAYNICNGANMINQVVLPDQRDREAVLNTFAEEFMKTNQSAISDQLYGTNLNVTKCQCGTCLYNYQTYFFIIFPLEEVRQYRNNKDVERSSNNQNAPVTLQDCFEYDKKVNAMQGDNAMYCNYCKQTRKCEMQTVLVTVPKNLILLFNRGKGIEFNVNINYPEFLDQYNIGQDFKFPDQKYTIKQAYSTIKHAGNSGMDGHFFMDGVSERDGSSNRYNDGFIENVNGSGMPYLVFYRDMDPDELINCVLRKVSLSKNLSNYLEAIAVKFSELSELDTKKEGNNKSRTLRFSYLLMQAVLPDQIQNGYKSLSDQKASNLLCAIFEILQDEKNFDDKTMENYRSAIRAEKEAIRYQNQSVNIGDSAKNLRTFANLPVDCASNGNKFVDNEITEQNVGPVVPSANAQNIDVSNDDRFSKNNEKPNNKSLWLRIIFAGILAVSAMITAIVAIELYWISIILAAVAMLVVFGPKIWNSCRECICRKDKPYNLNTSYGTHDREKQNSIDSRIRNNNHGKHVCGFKKQSRNPNLLGSNNKNSI